MVDTPTLEVPKTVMLDEVLTNARKLSPYDKLVLVQILIEESLRDPLILMLKPTMVIESFTPYEIEGITDDLMTRLNSAPQPIRVKHAT